MRDCKEWLRLGYQYKMGMLINFEDCNTIPNIGAAGRAWRAGIELAQKHIVELEHYVRTREP